MPLSFNATTFHASGLLPVRVRLSGNASIAAALVARNIPYTAWAHPCSSLRPGGVQA
jgi:hypothetical protein